MQDTFSERLADIQSEQRRELNAFANNIMNLADLYFPERSALGIETMAETSGNTFEVRVFGMNNSRLIQGDPLRFHSGSQKETIYIVAAAISKELLKGELRESAGISCPDKDAFKVCTIFDEMELAEKVAYLVDEMENELRREVDIKTELEPFVDRVEWGVFD